MKKFNSKSGFVLVFTAVLIMILSIMIPSFYSMAFSGRNLALLNTYRQQAYYNAHSGVEYAQFIIEHSSKYNPLKPSTWPKPDTFPCFDDPNMGIVAVSISSAGAAGGYYIRSTGIVKDITRVINRVHYTGGIIDSWS